MIIIPSMDATPMVMSVCRFFCLFRKKEFFVVFKVKTIFASYFLLLQVVCGRLAASMTKDGQNVQFLAKFAT